VPLFWLYGKLGYADYWPWPAFSCWTWALSYVVTGNPAVPIIAHFSQNMLTLLLSRLSPLEPIRIGSLVEVGHFVRR
jgi:membrane protease YdiL (CAAX protease family)